MPTLQAALQAMRLSCQQLFRIMNLNNIGNTP
jgi:hypothetical protein